MGCQFPSNGTGPEPTDPTNLAISTPRPSDTATASATPQSVMFIAPEDVDAVLVAELVQEIARLAEQAGMGWEQRSSITPEEVPEGTKILVAFANDPGMMDLVQANPDVQFLAIGIPNLAMSANLSVLGPQGMPYDRQAFVAGFIAAMVGDDWRVGSLAVVDQPGGIAAQNGFLQGARFFCGQCRSAYPPYMELPTFISITSSDTDWSEALESFRASRIAVAYLFPTPVSEGILRNLQQSGMLFIGSQVRPTSLPADRWVATVRFDPAAGLREQWDSLLLGQGGLSAAMPLVLEDINEDIISPGRLRLAQTLIQDLISGKVETAVDPLTGGVQ